MGLKSYFLSTVKLTWADLISLKRRELNGLKKYLMNRLSMIPFEQNAFRNELGLVSGVMNMLEQAGK